MRKVPQDIRLARRLAARQRDKERARKEAAIADLEKRGATTEQIDFTMMLCTPELPPATKFIIERWKGVAPERFWDTAYDTVFELLGTDVPLDPWSRQVIKAVLQHFRFPVLAEQSSRKAEQLVDDYMKKYLVEDRGMTATEADQKIAKSLHATVGALRRRRQRRR